MRWLAMTIEDPWGELTVPQHADSVNARRVDSNLQWGFFWARSAENQSLLILRHDADASPSGRLPRMRGVEMSLTEGEEPGMSDLVIRLLDPAHRDIFYQLCR